MIYIDDNKGNVLVYKTDQKTDRAIQTLLDRSTYIAVYEHEENYSVEIVEVEE